MLGLVPLDDRPVSLSQTVLLAESAGFRVLHPPRSLLGRARRPGRPDAVAAWLEANFGRARGWVVSLDMLAYGGLVASRTLGEPLSVCLRRLERLARLKKRFPHVPLYAFQAIRRKSTTVSSSVDLKEWAAHHRSKDPLKAHRRRNHAVNLAAARLCARGAVDVLSLLQEDATPRGPHKREQAALLKVLARAVNKGRATLTPGTDEGAMVLLARLMLALEGRTLRLKLVFSSAAGARRVAPYEDRPIARTVAGQARALGARLVRGGAQADLELWVWCPNGRAGDLCFEPPVSDAKRRGEARRFSSRLAAALGQGRRVALADLAYANGADPVFMDELSRRAELALLAGYGAWNTAGNSIGSALARGALRDAGPAFLAVRLADDWGYQAVARPVLRRRAAALGADEWRLTAEERRALERGLNADVSRWARRALGPALSRLPGRLSLPWNRLFEVEVPCAS